MRTADRALAGEPAVADETRTDAELARCAQHDSHAFAPLYLRYRDRVYAYCAYRLANREQAEDAAAEIFLKALRGLAGFRARDGSFRSWLFVIAHNEVLNQRTYQQRHPVSALDAAAGVALQAPDDQIAAADAYRRVRELVGHLPPRERAVLDLRAAELDAAEIARVLGITEQNVRTVQCRAVAHLRAAVVADANRESPHGR